MADAMFDTTRFNHLKTPNSFRDFGGYTPVNTGIVRIRVSQGNRNALSPGRDAQTQEIKAQTAVYFENQSRTPV
jgi:hypothetical protein